MNNQTITRKAFDYLSLNDKATRATLRTEATAIKAAVKRTHDNIIEIGNRLIHAKELLEHGEFQQWIEGEFGMGYDMAWNFMNAAKRFSKIDFNQLLGLPQTAIFALARPAVSDETRAVALEMAASGDLKTTADAKDLIDAAKPPKPAETAPADDDSDDSDPFGDDGEPDFSQAPAPVGSEEEWDHPFADEDEIEGEVAEVADGLEVSNSTPLNPSTGLESPEVEAAPPTVEEQIEALPLAQALALYQHNGHIFRQQATIYLENEKALGKFRRTVQGDTRHAKGPVSDAFKAAIGIPHPSDWEGCPSCKGSLRVGERADPCGLCNGVGFTTRKNEGVSADVVEQHAKSL